MTHSDEHPVEAPVIKSSKHSEKVKSNPRFKNYPKSARVVRPAYPKEKVVRDESNYFDNADYLVEQKTAILSDIEALKSEIGPLKERYEKVYNKRNERIQNNINYRKRYDGNTEGAYNEEKRFLLSQELSELQTELDNLENQYTFLNSFFSKEVERKIKAEVVMQKQVFGLLNKEISEYQRKIDDIYTQITHPKLEQHVLAMKSIKEERKELKSKYKKLAKEERDIIMFKTNKNNSKKALEELQAKADKLSRQEKSLIMVKESLKKEIRMLRERKKKENLCKGTTNDTYDSFDFETKPDNAKGSFSSDDDSSNSSHSDFDDNETKNSRPHSPNPSYSKHANNASEKNYDNDFDSLGEGSEKDADKKETTAHDGMINEFDSGHEDDFEGSGNDPNNGTDRDLDDKKGDFESKQDKDAKSTDDEKNMPLKDNMSNMLGESVANSYEDQNKDLRAKDGDDFEGTKDSFETKQDDNFESSGNGSKKNSDKKTDDNFENKRDDVFESSEENFNKDSNKNTDNAFNDTKDDTKTKQKDDIEQQNDEEKLLVKDKMSNMLDDFANNSLDDKHKDSQSDEDDFGEDFS